MRDASEVRYRLDARNSFVFINDAWISEARAVPQFDLASSTVLGRGIWDLIRDWPLQHIFDGLFYRLRSGQIPQVTYRFRCDTPVARRLHHLTIISLPDHSLDFRVSIVATNERPRIKLLDPAVSRSQELLRICSWCKRIPLPGQGWLEIEESIAHLPALDAGLLPALTHGMCPACEHKMLELLGNPAASGPEMTSFGEWHSP